MLNILEGMLKSEIIKLRRSIADIDTAWLTSFEIYSEISKRACKLRAYDFIDDLWDNVAELSWAQIYKIDKIDYVKTGRQF